MRDEENFHRALQLSTTFINVDYCAQILHPTLPSSTLEVDNYAQKGATIFVFEGKATDEDGAISQLQKRHQSFTLFKDHYLKFKHFSTYTRVRLFYYSFKKKTFAEYDSRGKKLSSVKFPDVNVLASLLGNL